MGSNLDLDGVGTLGKRPVELRHDLLRALHMFEAEKTDDAWQIVVSRLVAMAQASQEARCTTVEDASALTWYASCELNLLVYFDDEPDRQAECVARAMVALAAAREYLDGLSGVDAVRPGMLN